MELLKQSMVIGSFSIITIYSRQTSETYGDLSFESELTTRTEDTIIPAHPGRSARSVLALKLLTFSTCTCTKCSNKMCVYILFVQFYLHKIKWELKLISTMRNQLSSSQSRRMIFPSLHPILKIITDYSAV